MNRNVLLAGLALGVATFGGCKAGATSSPTPAQSSCWDPQPLFRLKDSDDPLMDRLNRYPKTEKHLAGGKVGWWAIHLTPTEMAYSDYKEKLMEGRDKFLPKDYVIVDCEIIYTGGHDDPAYEVTVQSEAGLRYEQMSRVDAFGKLQLEQLEEQLPLTDGIYEKLGDLLHFEPVPSPAPSGAASAYVIDTPGKVLSDLGFKLSVGVDLFVERLYKKTSDPAIAPPLDNWDPAAHGCKLVAHIVKACVDSTKPDQECPVRLKMTFDDDAANPKLLAVFIETTVKGHETEILVWQKSP